MKAKVIMLALLGAFAFSFGAQAQQEEASSQNLNGHKTIYNRDGSRWFIDIQGGAVMLPFGEANNKAEFMDRISWGMPMLGIGAWHNPYFGTRLQLYGWRAYGFEFADATNSQVNRFGNFVVGANYQFLFDMVNYFGTFNPNRVFHFSPFVGFGANYLLQVTEDANFSPALEGYNYMSSDNDFNWMNPFGISMNAGIQFRFRLHRVVDLNIEAQAIASNNNFRGSGSDENGLDIMALVTAGLSFNLNPRPFTELVPMDWGLVNDLNGQINSLRAENAELSKRPVSCPECPEVVETVPETETVAYYSNVFFRIGSSKIDANQMPTVKMIADYLKESGANVHLTGYADAQTGTPEFNMTLSELRVNAVRDALVEEGVDEAKIVTDFKGCEEQPYEVNKMNRVVIATNVE